MNLLQKIETRQGVVAVIGLGYVGLPLAVAFAEAGFRVIGIDVDEERMQAINRGESYVSDVPSDQVAALTTAAGQGSGNRRRLPAGQPSTLRSANRLSGTTDYDRLYEADAVIICVPTPLDKTKDPDMSYVIAATDEIGRRLRHDMLVVLESTTYPGTTEELILPRLQAETRRPKDSGINGQGAEISGSSFVKSTVASHADSKVSRQQPVVISDPESVVESRRLVAGKDFFLAFSPERIDPGRIDYTIHNTPKVIGGVTPACLEVARALYECVIDQVVPVSSPKVAEMVKLLENTFRAVNIGLVNEVAIMCNRLGIDVWEVIEAAKTKPFGFMPFLPGPGLGGHCIPIDPQFLAWKLKTMNYHARFIQLAGEINFEMPHYVLGKIADALNDDGKPLNGSQLLILGVAYKADVGDLRESPALELIHLLGEKGTKVVYHDPFVPRLDVDGLNLASVPLDLDTLQKADCVVIATAHSAYDWEWVVSNSRLVVDTRNATKSLTANRTRIVKL
jgi:UDP-N-acetyl-D-glucosamine dehydrogenase